MNFLSIFNSSDKKPKGKGRNNPTTDLNEPLFEFYEDNGDVAYTFTVEQAMRGTFVTGSIGSGKTSGSGDFLGSKFLEHGWGGVVLCGKTEEAQDWKDRIKRAGRPETDVVHFCEGSIHEFNPLAYQMARIDAGGQKTELMVTMFMALARLGNRMRGGGGGGSSDPFWDLTLESMSKSGLDVLKYADLDVSIPNLTKLLTSIPNTPDLFYTYQRLTQDPKLIADNQKLFDKYEEAHPEASRSEIIEMIEGGGVKGFILPPPEWERSVLMQALLDIEGRYLGVEDRSVMEVAKQFFLLDFPGYSEKLRSSIMAMYYAFANPFRAGMMATHFSKGLTEDVLPEATFEGKIVLLDFPVHRYGVFGAFCQTLYKRSWQEAVQRRPITDNTRPVFLFIDEYQLFADPDDQEFLTTARKSCVAPVFLTQNISNLYAAIGNRDKVISMLGNLVNKFAHQNGDYHTNEYMSRIIAKKRITDASNDMRDTGNLNLMTKEVEQVMPNEFTTLANGGERHDYHVEVIMTGDRYGEDDSGQTRNFMRGAFRQHFDPEFKK